MLSKRSGLSLDAISVNLTSSAVAPSIVLCGAPFSSRRSRARLTTCRPALSLPAPALSSATFSTTSYVSGGNRGGSRGV